MARTLRARAWASGFPGNHKVPSQVRAGKPLAQVPRPLRILTWQFRSAEHSVPAPPRLLPAVGLQQGALWEREPYRSGLPRFTERWTRLPKDSERPRSFERQKESTSSLAAVEI